MVNIFAGLEKFGLSSSDNVNLFEDPEQTRTKKTAEAEAVVEATPEEKEKEILYDRTYTCPICDKEFKVKTVRSGKAKLIGTDIDLRAKHEVVDMVKYDTIVCPHCGYATLTRYFTMITAVQRKLVREKISADFKGINTDMELYTYEHALERYQLTLANAVVKMAKASEKAYICLKSAWLIRGMKEQLVEGTPDYEANKKQYDALEREYLKNAMEGFVMARQKESYPMCGMDEHTVDYLIAALAIENELYDIAAKLIAGMISSQATPSRIKEKARDLKDIILEKRQK